MSERFHAYSPWRDVPFDPDAVRLFALGVLQAGAVFVDDAGGMCGGMLTPLYFNPACRIAVEVVWWAPAGGAALRRAFEDWGRAQGVFAVQFSALGDERAGAVARLFGRAGFAVSETAFVKRYA